MYALTNPHLLVKRHLPVFREGYLIRQSDLGGKLELALLRWWDDRSFSDLALLAAYPSQP